MSDAAAAPSSPWQAAPRPVPVPVDPSPRMGVDFIGRRGALFWLALKTGFFTILTLGFYRFWMKTRLRRWYWSAIRPGGHPMEYVGDPWEKLLGFFIAVVILTFYIGIVNLILMFASFSIFNSSAVGYAASFAGVVPLWFYARYRARRYVLGRTRWRGVRFGLEPGAWGYAGRALLHWGITILTLGLLWPRMTFLLEKYRTDRTFFGSARLVQEGRWPMLYRATVPFILALTASLGLATWLFWLQPLFPFGPPGPEEFFRRFGDMVAGFATLPGWNAPWRLWLVPLCMTGLLYGAIHYRWSSRRIMANHKTAPGLALASRLSAGRVTMIYTFGNAISYLALVLGVAGAVLLGLAILGVGILSDAMGDPALLAGLPRWVSVVLLGAMYLGVFLLWGVLHNTFVTFPVMRHMALTTTLPRTEGLADVSQRARDTFAEAEGFAEALDLGAAI
jgi:hypothetical protein